MFFYEYRANFFDKAVRMREKIGQIEKIVSVLKSE